MNTMELISFGFRLSIFLLVFSVGLEANIEDRLYLFRRPKQIFRSILSISLIMPIVATILAMALDLSAAMKIALIAFSVAPIPPILPRKEVKAGADAGYAIGLLITTVLFSIIFIPLAIGGLTQLFGQSVHIPAAEITQVVFMTAILPLGFGMIVKHLAPKFAIRFKEIFSKLGSIILILCLVPALSSAWPTMLSFIKNGALVPIILFSLVAVFSGHFLGGPDEDDRTVLTLSTLCRHPGVAIVIGKIGFPAQQSSTIAVMLIFLTTTIISGIYLAWHRRHINHHEEIMKRLSHVRRSH